MYLVFRLDEHFNYNLCINDIIQRIKGKDGYPDLQITDITRLRLLTCNLRGWKRRRTNEVSKTTELSFETKSGSRKQNCTINLHKQATMCMLETTKETPDDNSI